MRWENEQKHCFLSVCRKAKAIITFIWGYVDVSSSICYITCYARSATNHFYWSLQCPSNRQYTRTSLKDLIIRTHKFHFIANFWLIPFFSGNLLEVWESFSIWAKFYSSIIVTDRFFVKRSRYLVSSLNYWIGVFFLRQRFFMLVYIQFNTWMLMNIVGVRDIFSKSNWNYLTLQIIKYINI